VKHIITIESQSEIKVTGTINGRWFRAKFVNTGMHVGPGKWSYRPDYLSRGERVAIGRRIAETERKLKG
jgi:hypothetical protein